MADELVIRNFGKFNYFKDDESRKIFFAGWECQLLSKAMAERVILPIAEHEGVSVADYQYCHVRTWRCYQGEVMPGQHSVSELMCGFDVDGPHVYAINPVDWKLSGKALKSFKGLIGKDLSLKFPGVLSVGGGMATVRDENGLFHVIVSAQKEAYKHRFQFATDFDCIGEAVVGIKTTHKGTPVAMFNRINTYGKFLIRHWVPTPPSGRIFETAT